MNNKPKNKTKLLIVEHSSRTFHSFIPDISIAPFQVHYYSEALPTTALILCWGYQTEVLEATVSEGLA